MKIETQLTEDHQVKITAEMDNELMDKYKHQAARKIAQQAKIPGFRPGKAPYEVVKRLYGEETLVQEGVELMVDDIYPDILKESNITPGGTGSLQEVVSTDPPKFIFVVPLEPEVDLAGYREIRKEYNLTPVEESEVDAFLKRMRSNYATAENVERPAQTGDLVYFKLTGALAQPAEAEEREVIKPMPMSVVIGDEEEEETFPYKGFNQKLIGLSSGDEKFVTYTFAEDAPNEKLRGREVELQINVESVKSRELPELNDEFAQNLGNFETVDALRKAVRDQIETNRQQEYDNQFYTDLIDQIAAQAVVKFSPQLLDQEAEHILENLEHDLGHQKLDLETYFKYINTTREKFIEEQARPAAQKRLVRSLILDKLSRDEKIELDKEELQKEFETTFDELNASTDLKKAQRKASNQELFNSIAMEAASRLMNRRTLERLKAIAAGQLVELPATAEEPAAGADAETAATSES